MLFRLIKTICVFFILIGLTPIQNVFSKDFSETLVLKARVFKVEAFHPEEVVDALDEASVQGAIPTATVSLLVKDVLSGELPLVKKQGNAGSFLGQAKDAVDEKKFLKILTMDFENPNVEHPEQVRWFAVGVQSPLESFNIISWKDLPNGLYRVSLMRKTVDSGWVLQSAEALKN